MPLTTGASLGPYVVRSLLGSGGMGDVYLAHDTKLDRDVALKLLPAELASDPERLRRFELEARAASALNHPAIVTIYDLGEVESQLYISMELVEGQTLRQILQAGSMQPRRALQVAAPIADGLAKAHEAGIVHRDLKPENLMVSHDGFVKILDFGLAKLAVDAEARATLPTMTEKDTRPGRVMGTVGYMSPEQASGDRADNRSDQFSFGLVLYEMLTGRRAFNQPTAVETLAAIIRDDPPSVGQLNPSIPAPVQWIVDRCLAKAPADRYGSTRDLARDLARAGDHFSQLTSSGARVVPDVAPAVRVSRRELVAWLLVATLVLAASVLMVSRIGEPPAETGRLVRFTLAPPANVSFESPFGMSPFAVSPDGHHLVFAGLGTDGRRGLWLHSFDSLISRPLPGTDGGTGPFWSPDGLTVAFFTENRLKRTSIAGGDVDTICEARFGGGGTWNRDGVIVFAPGIDTALFRVAAAGGTPTPVTVLDPAREESGHVAPLFLPDGRHVVFGSIGGASPGIYVAALDSAERKRLSVELSTLGFSSPDVLFFMRERTLMAQRLDLNRLELTGEPIRVAEGIDKLGFGSAFAVSASGTFARISPNGRWMAYTSNESGSEGVYVTRFPEPGVKWPVSTNGGSFPVWRHDSRELFYRAADGKLMAVPVGPGSDFAPGAPISLFEPPRAEISTLGFGTFYDVAPDGRFLINILKERTSPPATVVLNWRTVTPPLQP